MAGKGDLAFSLSFEIIPTIRIEGLFRRRTDKARRWKRPTHMSMKLLAALPSQYKDLEAKPEDGGGRKGDKVTISFAGKVDGEAFEGGTAEDVPLELGSGQFIPGFEDQLIGAKAGDELTVNVTFPDHLWR